MLYIGEITELLGYYCTLLVIMSYYWIKISLSHCIKLTKYDIINIFDLSKKDIKKCSNSLQKQRIVVSVKSTVYEQPGQSSDQTSRVLDQTDQNDHEKFYTL